jgi:hypothetical protein
LAVFFSFSIFYTAGRTPGKGDQPVARPLPAHRTAQTQNKCIQTSMPWVGFEPTTPLFERSKTVHALDSATAVIGSWIYTEQNTPKWNPPDQCRAQCQTSWISWFIWWLKHEHDLLWCLHFMNFFQRTHKRNLLKAEITAIRHQHLYNIPPESLRQWLNCDFWETVKRNVADYMREMKDIFEVEAKYARHDSSLGPNRLNWVLFIRAVPFPQGSFHGTEFLECVISTWQYRTYGKAEERVTKETSAKNIF